MLSRTVRHLVVAVALVGVVGLTAASAAGGVSARQAAGTAAPVAQRQVLPNVSGDLGEFVVRAPGDLGEIVVHAPGDLGEVLVNVGRLPLAGQLMADVVVTAPRLGAAGLATAMLAVSR